MANHEDLLEQLLQKMENIQLPGSSQKELSFFQRLEQGIDTVRRHHDTILQEKALSVIPVDEIHDKVELMLKEEATLSFEGRLTKALLHWFKNYFFKWVDTVSCDLCGSKTEHAGTITPNQEEITNGGLRVEAHRCSACGHMNRFPRYNNPGRLLETKRGRCGEWANCFGLVCTSMGLDARYILDFTDHVWTEVFCDNQWIHCDSCEASFNEPLLYEKGWGKKLSYIIAFDRYSVVDVTRRYSADYLALLGRRREVTELQAFQTILRLNKKLKSSLSKQLILEIAEREKNEQVGMEKEVKMDFSGLKPRQSGALEWKQARSEMG